MFKIINERTNNYRELHDKYPNKEALIYDVTNWNCLFSECTVYDICDDVGLIELSNSFKENIGNVLHTFLHTSPIDTDGTPYFED